MPGYGSRFRPSALRRSSDQLAGRQTWDVVPGAYLPDERAVVVATVERAGRRAVPALNDRHGSASLAVHEVMHGFDFSADRRPSQSGPFLSRWRADFARLKDDYFQDSETGSAEAYAESAARTYGLWAGLKDVWPNLRDYWLRPDRTYARTAPGGPAAASGPRPLGIGRLAEDGTVHLFLTALGNNGEHGHALIELAPNQLRGSPAWAAEGREVGETFDIFSLEGLEF